ncbi:unnamed protein product [Effrenium voratum]|uniref:SF4 helicase domain-containing protein n=1 Tax=Effrenium voratum TaxID=2562239 RepID=A0AA36HK98_9DINO|nr:unnamed protein product [Effrenium voratum]
MELSLGQVCRQAQAPAHEMLRQLPAAPGSPGAAWTWGRGSAAVLSAWAGAGAAAARKAPTARRAFVDHCETVQRRQRGQLSPEFESGVSTGWKKLDEFMRPVRGEVVVVCGQPGSGKSEFMLSLAVNLAKLHGSRTGLCLFEHKCDELFIQLLEKLNEVHFSLLKHSLERDRQFLSRHFKIISEFSEEATVTEILASAAALVEQDGLENLIIDPYNYIAKPENCRDSETELVSSYMTQIQRFAKKYKVCVSGDFHSTWTLPGRWWYTRPRARKPRATAPVCTTARALPIGTTSAIRASLWSGRTGIRSKALPARWSSRCKRCGTVLLGSWAL